MKLLHASLRYTREPLAVTAMVDKWRRQGHDVLTFTEATSFGDALQAPGYSTHHPKGAGGELAAMVKGLSSVRRVLQLSERGIPRRGGRLPFALEVPVDGTPVVVTHMPSGVQGRRGLRRGPQTEVWRDCLHALAKHAAKTEGPMAIVADWNVDARKAWVRQLLEDTFPGFRVVAPKAGTHGRRVIDFALVRGFTGTAVAVPNPASDHKAVAFDLQLKETTVSKFITKEQWGSNTSKEATEDSHPIGATRGITVHWEGVEVGAEPHSACAERVRNIERSHEYGRGWGDIAYNLLVCQHSYVFEGRGAGVRSAANGYTAANNSHYSVCALMGPGDEFTDAFRQGFLLAFDHLRDQGNAGPERNGHRDHKATQCPGDAIYTWVDSLPPGAGTSDRPTPTTPEEIDMTPDELRQIIREEIAAAFRGDSKRQVLDLGKARIEHPDNAETAKTLGRLLYSIRDAVKGEK